ncbi:MAG: hypothetical protein GY783_02620 [Gammaproteobacteria bacterium]|nr:hypothetical protein [Gammaproteobacteria bacterium]
METSPLLARRVIPRKERLQKALVILLVTAVAVAGAWVFTDVSLNSDPLSLIAIGSVAVVGLSISAYFWFKKEEGASTKEDSRFVRRRIDDDRQGRGWISRLGYNAKRILSGIVVLAGGLFVLAGLGVLGLQVFGYLKVGEWRPVSLLGVASPYIPWLNNPQSWFGLHDIVRNALGIMPLSLALILVGWLIAGFGAALRERATR